MVIQVLAVSILYVRCAGCDPADPGVHQSNRATRTKQQKMLKSMDLMSLPNLDTPVGLSHDESETNSLSRKPLCPSICSRWLLCLPFACCKKEDSTKLNVGELLLYCSICEAKVRHLLCLWEIILELSSLEPDLVSFKHQWINNIPYNLLHSENSVEHSWYPELIYWQISRNSKHCKACDKCVQEFDHHCRVSPLPPLDVSSVYLSSFQLFNFLAKDYLFSRLCVLTVA